jgi:predicted amino acid racemase
MNQLRINLDVLQHNIEEIDRRVTAHGANWTLTAKVLCGHADTLRALHSVGVRSIADSRLGNLQQVQRYMPDQEAWYLRLPHKSAIDEIVDLADVSLNSELWTLDALDRAARKQDKIHRVLIMIELGDLREGILPGELVDFYEHAIGLSNVEVIGIGANQGCLSGAVPNTDHLDRLALYKELLELKFDRPVSLVSGGSSSLLPLLWEGNLSPMINHLRIGEAVFLGTDLVNGGTLEGLRDDAFTLEAEIVELKEKPFVAEGDTSGHTPFEPFQGATPDETGRGLRALITMGELDAEMRGLSPVVSDYHLVGASSDLSVVHLGDNPNDLGVGDTISFRPSYAALLRLMVGPYVEKIVTPEIGEYKVSRETQLPAVLGEHELAEHE